MGSQSPSAGGRCVCLWA